MKKICIILILTSMFGCSFFVKPKQFNLRSYFDSGVLHIYTQQPINETSIPISNLYMSTSSSGANNHVVGESLYFENLEIDHALTKLKAKVKFTEYLKNQNLTIIYAYSKLIPKYEIINNIKINLQISTCEQYSVIGWPLIYGSF